jgi:hypothetical protein
MKAILYSMASSDYFGDKYGFADFLKNILKLTHTFLIDYSTNSQSFSNLLIMCIPPKRNKISLGESKMLAYTSLINAEHRRNYYAEKEAKILAPWEEVRAATDKVVKT